MYALGTFYVWAISHQKRQRQFLESWLWGSVGTAEGHGF